MSEQTVSPKVERSALFQSTKLGYECVMSSTKSFVHNFNQLPEEEKAEFKSLNTYVKQLEKCMSSLKNSHQQRPVSVSSKRVRKEVSPKTEVAPVQVQVQVQEQVTQVAQVAEVKQKSSKGRKPVSKTEQSPTAQEVATVQAESVQPVSSVPKKGKKEVTSEAKKSVKKSA